MRFRLLGPMEVEVGGQLVEIPRRRERSLLAVLLLSPNTSIPTRRLTHLLWDGEPSDAAPSALHSHISRLRGVLRNAGSRTYGVELVRDRLGYRMQVPAQLIDAERFRAQVNQARATEDLAERSRLLRQALDLWRDRPLSDASDWLREQLGVQLEELRLAAFEERISADLALGRAPEVLTDLARLAGENPLRQRLVTLHMLALHRAGRTGEALDVYEQTRIRYIGELGIDPGSQLTQLRDAILRGETGLAGIGEHLPPAPAQLPPAAGHFTGRQEELIRLDKLAGAGSEGNVLLITGPPGVGKTALALQWAHRAKDAYPDGQLFVDLRGHGTAVLSTSAVAAQILRALGVPADRTPATEPEQVALYRTLLSAKKMLILLDNAGSTAQVAPLLPATPSCVALVTSRTRLDSLDTHHAIHRVVLDLLNEDDAVTLLTRVAGGGRLDADRATVAELARLCGGFPLALRIAASKLAANPRQSVQRLTSDLTDQRGRLAELATEDSSRSVRAAFASAYRSMSARAARAFRLVGLHPGPTVWPELVAAMDGCPVREARQALDDLAAAHLLVEVGDRRYGCHDLIRLFATERAAAEESEEARAEARSLMMGWYVAVAAAANGVLTPYRTKIRPAAAQPLADPPFAARVEAVLDWLDGHRAELHAVVVHAEEAGLHRTVLELAYLLPRFYDQRGYWTEVTELCERGLRAAEALQDPSCVAVMHNNVAIGYQYLRQDELALQHFQQAVRLHDANGIPQPWVYANLGALLRKMGRHHEAIELDWRAIEMSREPGLELHLATALINLAEALTDTGRPAVALTHLQEALDIRIRCADSAGQAIVFIAIGEAHAALGDHTRAAHGFQRALQLARAVGSRRSEGDALNRLGETQLRLGDHTGAAEAFTATLALHRAAGDRHGEAAALCRLGEAWLVAGEPARAREHLRRSAALRARVPDEPEKHRLDRVWRALQEERSRH